jgi:hypothetical protein
MQYDTTNNKKAYLSTEEILSHAGKIVLSRKFNGKEFITLLMGIEDNDIVYRTKNGHLIKNPIDSICYIAEV